MPSAGIALHGHRGPNRQPMPGPAVGRTRLFQRLERDGTFGRYENIIDVHVVAAGTAHSERVPVVDDLRLLPRKQRDQGDRLAVLVETLHTVVVDVGQPEDPGRRVTVAVERASTAQPVATLDRNGPPRREEGASHDGPGGAEDLRGRLVRKPGSERFRGVGKRDVPARRAVDARELLDHPERGHRVELEAAPATRPEQAVAPRVPQRVRHGLCEASFALRSRSVLSNQGLELSNASEEPVQRRGSHRGRHCITSGNRDPFLKRASFRNVIVAR